MLWSSFLTQSQPSLVPGCLTIIVTLGQASCLGPQSDQDMHGSAPDKLVIQWPPRLQGRQVSLKAAMGVGA